MILGDFQFLNTGTTDYSQVPASQSQPIRVRAQVVSGDSWRLAYKTLPATPWNVEATFGAQNIGEVSPAIFLRDSTTGKLLLLGVSAHRGLRVTGYVSNQQWWADFWNKSQMGYLPNGKLGLSMQCGADDIIHFFVSVDGTYWSELLTMPRTAFLTTPDQCGFAVSDSGPDQSTVTVFDFSP